MSTARERVSGLIGLLCAAEAGVVTLEPRPPKGPQEAHCSPIELGFTPGASKSTVTSFGDFTCPGRTRANSSRRLCGFSTMPTTRRASPPTFQVSPTFRLKSDATPAVTATSSAAVG